MFLPLPGDGTDVRPRTAAGEYNEFKEASSENLVAHSEATVVVPSAVGLGFQGSWMMMNLLLRCRQNIKMNQRVRLCVL